MIQVGARTTFSPPTSYNNGYSRDHNFGTQKNGKRGRIWVKRRVSHGQPEGDFSPTIHCWTRRFHITGAGGKAGLEREKEIEREREGERKIRCECKT